eukprot:SAG22_NODE_1440_length_4416_cov_6.561038_4_plen_189_part_00
MVPPGFVSRGSKFGACRWMPTSRAKKAAAEPELDTSGDLEQDVAKVVLGGQARRVDRAEDRGGWYNQGTLVGIGGHFKRGRQADLSSTLLRRWPDRLAKRLPRRASACQQRATTGVGVKFYILTPSHELSRCVARSIYFKLGCLPPPQISRTHHHATVPRPRHATRDMNLENSYVSTLVFSRWQQHSI